MFLTVNEMCCGSRAVFSDSAACAAQPLWCEGALDLFAVPCEDAPSLLGKVDRFCEALGTRGDSLRQMQANPASDHTGDAQTPMRKGQESPVSCCRFGWRLPFSKHKLPD